MSEFEDHVVKAYRGAWDKLVAEHCDLTLRHVNESVFRYFFIQELLRQNVQLSIEDEWRRIDLLLKAPNCQAAIEFKFYDKRPIVTLGGKVRYKGGSGPQNFGEFTKSLEQLMSLETKTWYQQDKANVTERYFVLVGTKWQEGGRSGDFSNHYYPPQVVKMPAGITMKPLATTHEIVGNAEVFGWICSVAKQSIQQSHHS
ncbi:MAG: hypothetical protein ABI162_01150 [Luteolibacter sp.]